MNYDLAADSWMDKKKFRIAEKAVLWKKNMQFIVIGLNVTITKLKKDISM